MNPADVPDDSGTSDNPLSLVRPSWADPSYLMRAAYSRLTNVAVLGATAQQMLPSDPRRIAVIVPAQNPTPFGVSYGPSPDLPGTFLATVASQPQVFTLFSYLSLVTDAWYIASSAGPVTVPVIEILTQ